MGHVLGAAKLGSDRGQRFGALLSRRSPWSSFGLLVSSFLSRRTAIPPIAPQNPAKFSAELQRGIPYGQIPADGTLRARDSPAGDCHRNA